MTRLMEAHSVSLFQHGIFVLHSGRASGFKIECDALSDTDWVALSMVGASLVGPFGQVIGVPRGGTRLAEALAEHRTPSAGRLLIVDDVLTTGMSMEEMRRKCARDDVIGLVAFARGLCPDWVIPIFQMTQPLPVVESPSVQGAP